MGRASVRLSIFFCLGVADCKQGYTKGAIPNGWSYSVTRSRAGSYLLTCVSFGGDALGLMLCCGGDKRRHKTVR